MKILIISDTHRDDSTFVKLIKEEGPVDMLIHCGDVCQSEELYRELADCEVKIVSGNNDFYTDLNPEEEFDIRDYHCLLTHGHMYGVSWGTERLVEYAYNSGADIVFYGHTHIPKVEYDEEFNVWVVNPGSLSYPRQSGRQSSYIVMEIDKNGDLNFNLKFL